MNKVHHSSLDRFIGSYDRIIDQIRNVKHLVAAEFRDIAEAHEHLVHLALNEAEALAWQTPYPHLVFPTLAVEKVQSLEHWAGRQDSIRQADPELAYAA